jgi:RimJ/RimL family protein N-acetyltransferase
MLHELNPPYQEYILNLFQPLTELQPMCGAVLTGIYPGGVWVDDPVDPQTAFMSSYLNQGGTWCFLTGNPDNHTFNQALNQDIFNKQVIPEYTASMIFTCLPESWNERLATIFDPREPISSTRRHYRATRLTFDWRDRIPSDFTLLPMEQTLLELADLIVPNEVLETLEKWRTNPNLNDFGVVIKKDNEIVAWATVDFVANKTGDIGFFTVEKYRRHGFASIAAAAAIEQGLSNKLAQISWTCSENNIGSIHTAEKLGLTLERKYFSFWLLLDEASHLAQLAYTCLQNGKFQKTIQVYEEYFNLVSDPPAWAYYDLASAYGGRGETEEALRNLQTAVEKGWNDLDDLTTCQEFLALHQLPEWEKILQQVNEK